jgi:nucleoside-diphosphate-sugar epimerase
MIIGITGANGLIGTQLVLKLLDMGFVLHLLTRSGSYKFSNEKIKVFKGDILKPDTLDSFMEDISTLIHCAGETKEEVLMEQVNVVGTKNLLGESGKNLIHWIQLSSIGVYGIRKFGFCDEKEKPSPKNKYEKSKYESDMNVISESEKRNFKYTVLRPSVVVSVLSENSVFFKLSNSIKKNYFFYVRSKHSYFHFIDINTLTNSIVKSVQIGGNNKTYNISDNILAAKFVSVFTSKKFLTIPKYILYFFTLLFSKFKWWPISKDSLDFLSSRVNFDCKLIERDLQIKIEGSFEEYLNVIKKENLE